MEKTILDRSYEDGLALFDNCQEFRKLVACCIGEGFDVVNVIIKAKGADTNALDGLSFNKKKRGLDGSLVLVGNTAMLYVKNEARFEGTVAAEESEITIELKHCEGVRLRDKDKNFIQISAISMILQ